MMDDVLVTCNGCFDGLHFGHLFFLGFCRGQGSRLIVGINTDEYIIGNKRPNPTPQLQRYEALTNLGFIEKVEIFSEFDPRSFILRNRPNVHCIGEEYKDTAVELQTCKDLGIKVVYVPRIGTWSTTSLKGKNP